MKTKLKNAINAIETTDEMNEAIRLLKEVRRRINNSEARDAKSWLRTGMWVTLPLKTGDVNGIVDRIKTKKAIVVVDGKRYDAPFNMLKPAY